MNSVTLGSGFVVVLVTSMTGQSGFGNLCDWRGGGVLELGPRLSGV